MASSGQDKWKKYFGKGLPVKTLIKAKPTENVKITGLAKNIIATEKDGLEITVLPMKKYDSNYLIEFKKNGKMLTGFVSEKYVAKPIERKISSKLNSSTALDFAKLGKRTKIRYMEKDISVIEFTDPKTLEKSILQGLKDTEKDKTAGLDAFNQFFKSQYKMIPWTSETSDIEQSKYGVYIGELLIGLYYLLGKANMVTTPTPINKKAKKFYLPDDPSFSGIDSIIEFDDGKLLPISSKFGAGAKASIFSNILAKGVTVYKKMKPSVFRDLCEAADKIHVSKGDLESKRKSKDVVYAFGIRNILKIKQGSGAQQIHDVMLLYQELKQNKKSTDISLVLKKISDNDFADPDVLKKLPKSVTAFFSRTIAKMLNNDKVSLDQMMEILSGKDYWQANLNISKWQKGEVEFKMTSTKSMNIKIIGNKAAVDDIDAKQGLVNYEIRTS